MIVSHISMSIWKWVSFKKMPWKAAGTSLVDKRVRHVRLLLFRGGQDPQDRTSSVKPVRFLLYGSDINGSRVQKDRKTVWKGLWWSVSDVEILPILNWTDPRDGQSIAFLSNRLEIFITSGLLTLAFSDFHVFQVKLFTLFVTTQSLVMTGTQTIAN
jgi:hypothetical protein